MVQEIINFLFILFTFQVLFIVVYLLCNIPQISNFIMKDRRKFDLEVYEVSNGREVLIETYDNKPIRFLDRYR